MTNWITIALGLLTGLSVWSTITSWAIPTPPIRQEQISVRAGSMRSTGGIHGGYRVGK